MVNIPVIIPAIIINPIGICISPIRNNGPGEGGTNEFAMAAPAIIDKSSKR